MPTLRWGKGGAVSGSPFRASIAFVTPSDDMVVVVAAMKFSQYLSIRNQSVLSSIPDGTDVLVAYAWAT